MTGTAVPHDFARDFLQAPTLRRAEIVRIETAPLFAHRPRVRAEL